MPRINNPKVVIDTNLIISAIISLRSIPGQLLEAWSQNRYILLVSNKILDEIKVVSQRTFFKSNYPLFSEKAAKIFLSIKLGAKIVDPLPEEKLPIHCRDSKDDKLLALALGGGADYLVSGDKDLLVLNSHPKLPSLKIITAKAFLKNLSEKFS